MNPLAMFRDMRTIRALLERAETIGREMGDEEPGAEHLLLAAVDLPDGSAARALARVALDRERLRAAIVETHAEALASLGIEPAEAARLSAGPPLDPPTRPGLYRSRPSARDAFQAAGALARSSKERIAGAHVVAAVARMEHGTVARALERAGVERDELASAADAERRPGR